MPDTPTKTFGPYLVQQRLGAGGVAVVYKAVHQQSGETVALKILNSTWNEQSEVAVRFKKEAEIVTNLKHPAITAVYEYGVLKSRLYLVMQYMARGSLAQRFDEPSNINSQEVVRLLRRVSSALDHAHRKGVVHRDLKLENILLDERGDAYLSDFGIARVANAQRMTMTGSIVGTPMYMSPEQARGKGSLDFRADLYSLAVAAYLLTVGRFPFGGTDIMAILSQHVHTLPPLPTQVASDLPKALDTVLLRALSKKPEERYASADAFIEAYARAMADLAPRQTCVDLRSDRGVTSEIAEDPAEDRNFWAEPQVQLSPDELVKEARVTDDREKAIALLKKALEINPWHNAANRLLHKIEGGAQAKVEAKEAAISAEPPKPLPSFERKIRLTENQKRSERRKKWNRLGCISALMMSATCTLFTFSLVGILPPGFFTTVSVLLGGPTPVIEYEGVPVENIPDAAVRVPPSKSEQATNQNMDVMEPGYNHEYLFDGRSGEEVAVYIQFLSLSAHGVSRNVAVLDPNGFNIVHTCERESILQDDDNNVAYICKLPQTGQYRVRVFGRNGESTGVYFAGVQKLNELY